MLTSLLVAIAKRSISSRLRPPDDPPSAGFPPFALCPLPFCLLADDLVRERRTMREHEVAMGIPVLEIGLSTQLAGEVKVALLPGI